MCHKLWDPVLHPLSPRHKQNMQSYVSANGGRAQNWGIQLGMNSDRHTDLVGLTPSNTIPAQYRTTSTLATVRARNSWGARSPTAHGRGVPPVQPSPRNGASEHPGVGGDPPWPRLATAAPEHHSRITAPRSSRGACRARVRWRGGTRRWRLRPGPAASPGPGPTRATTTRAAGWGVKRREEGGGWPFRV